MIASYGDKAHVSHIVIKLGSDTRQFLFYTDRRRNSFQFSLHLTVRI